MDGENKGHGHVFKRPDGMLARCGGPAMCHECAADAAIKAGLVVPNEKVKKAAAGIRRLFIMRDTDEPMPSFDEIARAALEAAGKP